ncbi:phosphogluconate dehydrogenase (NADP(+)-dependent, decarboxylating), partial [Pseudomonas sp. FW305-25]
GEPCCAWIGTDGAGHFVKMVHNGIEYADMQVIGEAFDLLRSGAGIEPAEQAKIFSEWNKGELSSFLIEISAEVLGHVDAKTGKPFVD